MKMLQCKGGNADFRTCVFAILLGFGELEGLLLYVMEYGYNTGRGVWMC